MTHPLYFIILLLFTHYSRTIDAQYTDNTRTIVLIPSHH